MFPVRPLSAAVMRWQTPPNAVALPPEYSSLQLGEVFIPRGGGGLRRAGPCLGQAPAQRHGVDLGDAAVQQPGGGDLLCHPLPEALRAELGTVGVDDDCHAVRLCASRATCNFGVWGATLGAHLLLQACTLAAGRNGRLRRNERARRA